MKTVSEIRQLFLDYFKKNDHEIVESAPLIPFTDPSLMFVNAGMVPFKNYFTGTETPPFKRATSSQKCVRAGGKHNDLENVGYTARHHTFFEMLGNFSFGDYFKEEAIFYAWEFVTKELGLNKDKLLVTYYHDDGEAQKFWQKISGLSQDKIIPIATNDNFWSMGDTGPCGPCSEIFYDHGDKFQGKPPGQGDEGDRFIEIWNLVFMQFNQRANGQREALPNPAIDTGMGLERVSTILQNKHNNFEIDLFQHIIKQSESITNKKGDDYLVSHRVIADHLRASSFLIADGVLPSNEGRGYVLRRIMRRAMRHVYHLGFDKPLLDKLLPSLIDVMGEHYTELVKARDLISQTLSLEEERFSKTLGKGIKILEQEVTTHKGQKYLSGEIAFKLYDTYGFPLDLTEDIIKKEGLQVDHTAFDKLMDEQKERGKENWKGSGADRQAKIWFKLEDKIKEIEFTGYERIQSNAKILAILDQDLKEVKEIKDDKNYFIITDKTPFYAESGGQVGDIGKISGGHGMFEVMETSKFANFIIAHFGKLETGELKLRQDVTLVIDNERRKKIKANHSATHLLHKSLQDVLGPHVAQKGSYVGENILRFDFTHNKALERAEIYKIEKQVSHYIRQNREVATEIMDIDSAKKSGAMALFGEKYDAEVRVLSMGKDVESDAIFSKELCGGTHVKRLGDIAGFKIISEGSIASGVRRIEAITGDKALEYSQNQEEIVKKLSEKLKTPEAGILDAIEALAADKKQLQNQLKQEKQKSLLNLTESDYLNEAKAKTIFKTIEDLDGNAARELAFKYLSNKDAEIIVIFTVNENKVGVIVALSDNQKGKINAVEILQKITPIIGGKGGGGKENFAQGGGSKPQNIPQVKDLLLNKLL